jgi:hypothetical protein
MNISPVEIISMPNKSQEASHLRAVDQQRPVNEQMALNSKFHDAIMRQSEQTVAATKTDNPEFRYDAKEKGNNPYYFQTKKKKIKKDEKNVDNTSTSTNHKGFDIKI